MTTRRRAANDKPRTPTTRGPPASYVPYCTLAVGPDPQAGDDELMQAEVDVRPDQEQAVEAARRATVVLA